MTALLNPNKQLIFNLRQEIKCLARAQKRAKSLIRRIHLAACYRLLNELKGKPNSHVYTKPCWKNEAAAQEALVERIRTFITPTESPLRMYVFVGTMFNKLTSMQRAVQCAHALAECVDLWQDHPRMRQWLHTDKTLIFVTTPYLHLRSLPGAYYNHFTDSDVSTVATSAACIPVTLEEAEAAGYTKLPLLV